MVDYIANISAIHLELIVLIYLLTMCFAGSRWCESKDGDEFHCACRDGYEGTLIYIVLFL